MVLWQWVSVPGLSAGVHAPRQLKEAIVAAAKLVDPKYTPHDLLVFEATEGSTIAAAASIHIRAHYGGQDRTCTTLSQSHRESSGGSIAMRLVHLCCPGITMHLHSASRRTAAVNCAAVTALHYDQKDPIEMIFSGEPPAGLVVVESDAYAQVGSALRHVCCSLALHLPWAWGLRWQADEVFLPHAASCGLGRSEGEQRCARGIARHPQGEGALPDLAAVPAACAGGEAPV